LSGSGKSTLIKLPLRYFDIQSGSISINEKDIRDVTQDSLHRLISSIPQDVCLFNRTLMENIKYGRTNAAEEEVVMAAKKASADEFITALPKGYQTKVGERGVILSGGERQRIAIARAILKNAPILVFDEATSALDSQSEKHIQKSLSKLMKNKTVIAIAHRLSTLREMDRILVMEKGEIVEQGTHEALLRKRGIYAKLYKMQSDGFMQADK
jgi:ATP-binding cassette subfamily B protein